MEPLASAEAAQAFIVRTAYDHFRRTGEWPRGFATSTSTTATLSTPGAASSCFLGAGPGIVEHACEKFLMPDEDGYSCPTCAQWQGRVTAWDCKGSD
jgi:hypothetical protein